MSELQDKERKKIMDSEYCERTERYLRAIDKASKDLCDKFRQRCSDALQPLELQKYGIKKSSLDRCINSFADQLLSHISAECRVIVDDLELDEKLRSLSHLIEEQERFKGTPGWRPSGNPSEDVEDHLRQLYERHMNDLTATLRESQEKTNALEAQVANGNKDLERISAEIDFMVAKLDKIGNAACHLQKQLSQTYGKTDAIKEFHDES
ncbi:hypothetical protein HPB50_001703 [Hyalomma asiaticum]|uniref:Uncharacterized protein n=1 Tax=Hyalomma asiaticum TaxID=266040 RepID=A0ACB7SSF2_HYAAI|nr:hypothetical protein HPB50_001703 [Hyalomma asiaticum]